MRERPNIEEQMNEIIGSPAEIKVEITEHKKSEKKNLVKLPGKIVKRIDNATLQKMIDAKIDKILNEYEQGEYLLIRAATGECIKIKDVITIGKESACDFVIGDNPTISRFHAQLEVRGGKLIAKDTSLNGTYSNGKKLPKNQEIEIKEGSIIFSNEKFQIKKETGKEED